MNFFNLMIFLGVIWVAVIPGVFVFLWRMRPPYADVKLGGLVAGTIISIFWPILLIVVAAGFIMSWLNKFEFFQKIKQKIKEVNKVFSVTVVKGKKL